MPNLFPISIEVEEVAVGRVLRKLNLMEGIIHIKLKLQEEKRQLLSGPEEGDLGMGGGTEEATPLLKGPSLKKSDGRSFSRKGPPSKHIPYRAIAEVLQRTPAHLKILGAALGRVGLNPHSIDGYMFRMTRLKLVKRTAPGSYRLTEHGSKIFFSDTAPEDNRSRSQLAHPINNHSGFRGFFLAQLKKELDADPDGIGLLEGSDAIRLTIEAGFSAKNISTQGMKMRREGLVEFNNSHYSITEKGIEALAPLPEAQMENGSGQKEGLTVDG